MTSALQSIGNALLEVSYFILTAIYDKFPALQLHVYFFSKECFISSTDFICPFPSWNVGVEKLLCSRHGIPILCAFLDRFVRSLDGLL